MSNDQSDTHFVTDLSYLTRTKPFENPDPRYRNGSYDSVYCKTCGRTSIEPEIDLCEACGLDVCPHCCGNSYGYHEVCRQQVDDEIDPLIDRRAFILGAQSQTEELGLRQSQLLKCLSLIKRFAIAARNDRNAQDAIGYLEGDLESLSEVELDDYQRVLEERQETAATMVLIEREAIDLIGEFGATLDDEAPPTL